MRSTFLWVAAVLVLGACDGAGADLGTTLDATADAAADTLDAVADAADDVAGDAIGDPDAAPPGDTAVGVDASVDSVADTSPVTCPEEAVTVYLYVDGGAPSTSAYDQPQGAADAPLTGATVRLLSPAGVTRDAVDCGPGRYGFLDLPAGPHALDVGVDRESTSNNHGRRLPRAIAAGAVKILTFGDSVPAYGPTPWFPSQLATLLAPLATVDDVNQAIPGSQTGDWLPGGANYATRLAPHLADADVVVFSLGGNDLMDLAMRADITSVEDALAMLDELDAAIAGIEANLATIYAALRAAAPDADVLWFLYPNYAMSDHWAAYLGDYQELAVVLMASKLEDVRARMAAHDGLMIADMYGAVDKPTLDALLWDELHLNVPGHRYYAEEVFLTLGGVLVDPAPRGQDRKMGFAP